MHMCFSEKKKKQFYLVTASLKLLDVELSHHDRFVIQFNMFLLPYVFGIEFDFLKKC